MKPDRTLRLHAILGRLMKRLDMYEGEAGYCPLFLRDRMDRIEWAIGIVRPAVLLREWGIAVE